MALLCVLGVLLAALVALVIWQRDTVYFMLHPGRIAIKSAQEIEAALRAGGFDPQADPDGALRYTLLDRSVRMRVVLGEDKLATLDAEFNMYGVPLKTIPAALDAAQSVLSPFLTPPEIKALIVLIAGEMPAYVSADTIDYRRELGDYTLRVRGDVGTGNATVWVGAAGLEVQP